MEYSYCNKIISVFVYFFLWGEEEKEKKEKDNKEKEKLFSIKNKTSVQLHIVQRIHSAIHLYAKSQMRYIFI